MVCVEEDMLMILLEENRYIGFFDVIVLPKIHWKLALI